MLQTGFEYVKASFGLQDYNKLLPEDNKVPFRPRTTDMLFMKPSMELAAWEDKKLVMGINL